MPWLGLLMLMLMLLLLLLLLGRGGGSSGAAAGVRAGEGEDAGPREADAGPSMVLYRGGRDAQQSVARP